MQRNLKSGIERSWLPKDSNQRPRDPKSGSATGRNFTNIIHGGVLPWVTERAYKSFGFALY